MLEEVHDVLSAWILVAKDNCSGDMLPAQQSLQHWKLWVGRHLVSGGYAYLYPFVCVG